MKTNSEVCLVYWLRACTNPRAVLTKPRLARAEVGIDDSLLQDKFAANEEIFQMNNGCICCTVRGDLIRILRELVKVSPPRPLTTSSIGPIKG